MNIERDKFLTEAMGECWHESFYINCAKCAGHYSTPNFSTWEGFGKLWEWAQKQEWWKEWDNGKGVLIREYHIHPDRFADTVYEFLKER